MSPSFLARERAVKCIACGKTQELEDIKTQLHAQLQVGDVKLNASASVVKELFGAEIQ